MICVTPTAAVIGKTVPYQIHCQEGYMQQGICKEFKQSEIIRVVDDDAIKTVSQAGFSRSRCWDGVWSTKCLLGIDICEGTREEAWSGRGGSQIISKPTKCWPTQYRDLEWTMTIRVVSQRAKMDRLYNHQVWTTLGKTQLQTRRVRAAEENPRGADR